jgi:hypothetical protein
MVRRRLAEMGELPHATVRPGGASCRKGPFDASAPTGPKETEYA